MITLNLCRKFALLIFLAFACLLPTKPAHAATTTIIVNASGTATTECTGLLFLQTCNDVYAEFDLYVQGVKVGATQTTTGSYQNFTFNSVTVPSTGTFNVDVHFINDYSCNSSSLLGLSSCSGDRDIGINSVTVGSDTITPAGETIDAGNRLRPSHRWHHNVCVFSWAL